MLEWCYTGRLRFTEAFFGDTIDQVQWDLAALLFRHQTTLDEAKLWNRRCPGLPPSGFIFHMSRCGSTLVTQMLGALPRNRVLSEPTTLHGVIRAALLNTSVPRETVVDWLRTVVSSLGCPLEGETHYFVKFDAWHVLALPLIVKAFPETPWIFLYRDPAEVLVSQLRMPGAWTVVDALAPEAFGVEREIVFSIPRAEYIARGLAGLCAAALEHRECGRGLMVNYDRLPEFVCEGMLRHFGLALGEAELDLMRAASRRDAKMPGMEFAGDREVKRRAITPEIRELVEKWLSPLYERLERLR
jgi:hypothetical protein